jgi:hypothetical protein
MKALARNRVDKEDVRRMPKTELASLGVRLLNHENFVLQCLNCEETWSPQLGDDGKLPFDAFLCPVGCNR